MIHELRLYSVTQGRMADALARFTDHLPAMFARHCVRCVGAWTALTGSNGPRFVYLMAWADHAQREAAWASFYGDPEWTRVRAQTNAGHEMVERSDVFLLKPNIAWTPDPRSAEPAGAIHEMTLQQVAPGQTAAINEFLASSYLPLLREQGARTLGVFDVASGPGMPQLVIFQSWNDGEAWRRGRLAMEGSASLRQAFGAQRQRLGHPFFARAEVDLLEPVPGATIAPALGRDA
jgi:hypothetical protein